MKTQKPEDISGYKEWLKEDHQVEISARTETYYNAVTSRVRTDFLASSFWKSLVTDLDQINQGYYVSMNYYLFGDSAPPELQTKSFESFLLKTFRQNILDNINWPEPPDSGWLLPENWFSRVNDAVRTYFVVKYLDGVNFLAEKFAERATAVSYESHVDFEAKEEGYYAAHFYVTFPCEVPCEDWDTRHESISIEIQITTQIQEVIRRLLHKYYEQRRGEPPTSDLKWQWDYRSDEFAANYLGHILHYVEGMIMDVRDHRVGKESKHEG